MKTLAVVIGGILLIVALAVGGWQGGWWLQKSAVSHQNHITHESYNFQTAAISDMNNLLSQIAGIDVEVNEQPQNIQALDAQKVALESQFCSDYNSLNAINVPVNLKAFAGSACTNPNP